MDYKVTIQVIDYLANRYTHKVNKLSILKLLFFAERYHMRKYARMITDDTFFAMRLGPVASAAKEMMDTIDASDSYSGKFLQTVNTNYFKSKQKFSQDGYDFLSETDKEALDFAFDTFGHLSSHDLVEETHKYPEWKKFEKLFEHSSTKRENVDIDDFFSDLISEDDPYKAIPMENVKLSQELFHTGF
jgi:uncharacterized phage-associated protein